VSTTTATPTAAAAPDTLRGPVLDVLAQLLVAGRSNEVVALFEKLVARNRELELLLATMRNSKNRGEAVSQAQLDLFLQTLKVTSNETLAEANQTLEAAAKENAGRPETTKPPRQPAVRRTPSAKLRRVDNPIAVPEADRPCPVCGAPRKCITHEATEVIDLIPAEVIVRRDIREVLGCDACDAELIRAPMADKVIEAGAYGSRLVAELVVGKYHDGLPLHRQGDMLKRLGLDMPSSSMSDQITWATDLLRPIWRALIDQVLGATVMHLDGTSLPVRDRDGPKGIVTGALWGYVGDTDVAAYLYTSTAKKLGQREGEVGPEELLARRIGFVCADASNLFDESFKNPARIEIGCNMHARRYFVKALDAGDARAALPIAAFKTLYDVEGTARPLSPEARLDQRQRRSKPVYDQLIAWCATYKPLEPPSSLMGKAIQYLSNHQLALTRFLDDGRLPIDNGIVERLHRRPAITRRAFLFAGSHAAAERAAIAYSILGTCTLLDINPTQYLADVLPRLARGVVIARDVPAMLPAAWRAQREAAPAATPDTP
jgi:transposase